MINYAAITAALAAQLLASSGVSALLKVQTIERGGFVNVDADQCPWVGVYRGAVKFEPRTLGSINNWEAFPTIRILAQAASYQSGSDCEDRLEALVKACHEAVLSDTTIGGTVDMVTGFTVDYSYREDERETVHYQQAMITLQIEVRTS